jgi:hypothetical protein
MRSALPHWLRLAWLFLLPCGLSLAVRLAWEEAVLKSQNIGFGLMHVHPMFAIVGGLCCYLLMLWIIPASVFGVLRRKNFTMLDGAMILVCVFVAIVIVNSGH